MPSSQPSSQRSSLRPLAIGLAAALALPFLAAPLAAQSAWTLAQVDRRWPGLSPRQLLICDLNGDRMFDQGERACVSSLHDIAVRNF